MVLRSHLDQHLLCPPQSRIYNLRETKVIRDLNPADINKLISVSGMVRRMTGLACRC